MTEISLARTLVRESDELGVHLDEHEARQIIRYIVAILDANRQTNLTRIVEPAQAARLHGLDSLAAAIELDLAPQGRILDLGSGGGFPGVPLAIQSGRQTTLLDSVRKKMVAVQEAVESTGLGELVHTVVGRAEEHAREHHGEYSAVLARAVAPLGALVELAAPLLRRGGVFIAMKGAPTPEELASGRGVAEVVGLEEVSVRAFTLPEGGETRSIVAYGWVRESKIRLPRRVGLAQHQPLK